MSLRITADDVIDSLASIPATRFGRQVKDLTSGTYPFSPRGRRALAVGRRQEIPGETKLVIDLDQELALFASRGARASGAPGQRQRVPAEYATGSRLVHPDLVEIYHVNLGKDPNYRESRRDPAHHRLERNGQEIARPIEIARLSGSLVQVQTRMNTEILAGFMERHAKTRLAGGVRCHGRSGTLQSTAQTLLSPPARGR